MYQHRSIPSDPDTWAKDTVRAAATSIIVHALLLLAFFTVNLGYVPPLASSVVEVELAREEKKTVVPFSPGPEANSEPKADGPEKRYAAVRPKETPPPKPGLMEETVSLNSDEPRYYGYLVEVKHRIENLWRFPEEARKNRVQGRLFMEFSIGAEGKLSRIRLLRSSGHNLLDRAATAAVSGAAPFPPFPEHLDLDLLHIRASFDYRLTR